MIIIKTVLSTISQLNILNCFIRSRPPSMGENLNGNDNSNLQEQTGAVGIRTMLGISFDSAKQSYPDDG